MKNKNTNAETIYEVETWKQDNFTAQLVSLKNPPPSLNSAGRIMFYHTLTMEAGKASIAAALMTAIELYKVKLAHPGTFEAWMDANLHHGSIKIGKSTVYRYLDMLQRTVGRNVSVDELAQDSEKSKIEAVATFTKYTNYQSLYQLYNGEGIVKKSNLGGAGRGQGRKKKDDAAELAKAADDISRGLNRDVILETISQLYVLTVTNDGFEDLETSAIRNEIEMLEKMTARAKDILKSRKEK